MNVFSAIVNSPFDDLDISKLIHESSHDSCWRSDVKAFEKAHFEMASEVNEKIKKDGFAEIAPHEMSAGNASVNNLFNWINIKLINDPDKHRKIVVLD